MRTMNFEAIYNSCTTARDVYREARTASHQKIDEIENAINTLGDSVSLTMAVGRKLLRRATSGRYYIQL